MRFRIPKRDLRHICPPAVRIAVIEALAMACGAPPPELLPSPSGACAVKSITNAGAGNETAWSADGTKYLVNKKDAAGIYEVYVAPTGMEMFTLPCITCAAATGSPSAQKHRLMANWHPSGQWVMVGVAMDGASWPPLCSEDCVEGLLESGVNLEMYAVKADGSAWYRVVQFDPSQPSQGSGYTGPAFTPDGQHAYWAKIVNGDILQYGFGKWRLMRSDFVVDANGTPSMQNTTDVTPAGANWVEPGNFAPDGETLLLSSDIGLSSNATFGQDQWTLNVVTGAVENLTGSPDVWDEHGLFSPSGRKIAWMSSLPYRGESTWVGNLMTEFLLMDADGSNVTQLTHFNVAGYPESTSQHSVAAVPIWSLDGTRIYGTQLEGLSTQYTWIIQFAGPCG